MQVQLKPNMFVIDFHGADYKVLGASDDMCVLRCVKCTKNPDKVGQVFDFDKNEVINFFTANILREREALRKRRKISN